MDEHIEELRRLLPAPMSADLEADRHLLLKEHLMQAFTQPSSPAAAQPRRRRLVVSLAAATAVAALAAVGAVVALRDDPAQAPAQTQASSPAVVADTPVGQFMNQVALVAQ